jgi:Kef-type K+ transport system membrane component KefB
MAGMDLDLQKVKGRPLSLALFGWCVSLVLGLWAAVILHVLPFVSTPVMVAFALTTTSLGTLTPILRDAGELDSKFGSFLLAAGAAGEFGLVVVISLVLTPLYGAWREHRVNVGVCSDCLRGPRQLPWVCGRQKF